jgi:hypothetical protein
MVKRRKPPMFRPQQAVTGTAPMLSYPLSAHVVLKYGTQCSFRSVPYIRRGPAVPPTRVHGRSTGGTGAVARAPGAGERPAGNAANPRRAQGQCRDSPAVQARPDVTPAGTTAIAVIFPLGQHAQGEHGSRPDPLRASRPVLAIPPRDRDQQPVQHRPCASPARRPGAPGHRRDHADQQPVSRPR